MLNFLKSVFSLSDNNTTTNVNKNTDTHEYKHTVHLPLAVFIPIIALSVHWIKGLIKNQ